MVLRGDSCVRGGDGRLRICEKELYPVLQSIIDWHIKGTRYGIQMLRTGYSMPASPEYN